MASTRFAPEADEAHGSYGAPDPHEYPHTFGGPLDAPLGPPRNGAGPTAVHPRFGAFAEAPAAGGPGGSPAGAEEGAAFAPPAAYGPEPDGPYEEWNPTADSVRPVRGRHRVAKQRGGMARSGAVLGVGMMAAVGAGSMAGAKEKPAPVSVPDLESFAGSVAAEVPTGLAGLVSDDAAEDTTVVAGQAPLGQVGSEEGASPAVADTGAGETLRARILEQAAQQQSAADATAREEAAATAAEQAAEAAAKKAEAERQAEAERKRKAAEEARRKAEAERLAELARSYTLPVSSYTLTSGFGAGGSMWANDHTGQDFAAQTGTPVQAVHSGTVKEAGWAGSYGYRIVLELGDGTEVWYCHLSSMNVSVGAEVNTEDVIGNVGSTGNSTGPHLHLEVRPGGGDPIDPLSWLRGKGLGI